MKRLSDGGTSDKTYMCMHIDMTGCRDIDEAESRIKCRSLCGDVGPHVILIHLVDLSDQVIVRRQSSAERNKLTVSLPSAAFSLASWGLNDVKPILSLIFSVARADAA